MTVITVTTVGYGEVHPLSPAGRVFTVVVAPHRRRPPFFYTFTFLMARLVEGDLHERWSQAAPGAHARRTQRPLHPLRLRPDGRDHRPASSRARTCRSWSSNAIPIGCSWRWRPGSSRSRRTRSTRRCCKRVGIDRARGFIAAVSTDAENVYAVLSARLLKPDLFIVGRAETRGRESEAEARRRRPRDLAVSHRRPAAGADRAPAGGGRLRPARHQFREHGLNMEQVHIGDGSPLAGRSLLDADLRQRFGVVVVGIRRADGGMDFNPAPETRCAPATISSSSAARAASATSRRSACRGSVRREHDERATARRHGDRRRRFARRRVPDVQAFTARAGRPPGLGIVLVGENPASEVYVRNKVKAGSDVRAVGRSAAAAGHRVARRSAGARRDG